MATGCITVLERGALGGFTNESVHEFNDLSAGPGAVMVMVTLIDGQRVSFPLWRIVQVEWDTEEES